MSKYPHENCVDPKDVKMDQGKLSHVLEKFKKQQARGDFPGGQIAVRRLGKLVVNEVCGIGRGLRSEEGIRPVQVQPDTPFPVLSAGKPLAAIAVAVLEEHGQLAIDAPIAEIIPEFGQNGKSEITILDVLTHRTGILMPGLVDQYHLWGDAEVVRQRLYEAKPVYKRGTLAYAPYEYGWILSEIFLKVQGQSLADFVATEIATPLGLPALSYGLAERELGSLAYLYWLGKDKVVVGGLNVAEDFEIKNNSLEQINSLNPAVSMVTDAANLAAFYDFLVNDGISHSGEKIISKELIQKYTSRNISGFDRSSNYVSTLGRGFMLGNSYFSLYGWGNTTKCFGHAGGFSILAFGDHETEMAVAIVTNSNRGFPDLIKRFVPLSHGLRKACL